MHTLFPNTMYNSREVCAIPKLAKWLLMQILFKKNLIWLKPSSRALPKVACLHFCWGRWTVCSCCAFCNDLPPQIANKCKYLQMSNMSNANEVEVKPKVHWIWRKACHWFYWASVVSLRLWRNKHEQNICIMHTFASAGLARAGPAKRAD